jgi:hypothetical protein
LTYLYSNDDVDFAEVLGLVLVPLLLCNLDGQIEPVADDEAHKQEGVREQNHLHVLVEVSSASTDNVVRSLVDEPVQNAEHEENNHGGHLVQVKRVPEHNRQQQEVEDLLLALLNDVLHFDDADVSKEDGDNQVAELNQQHPDEVGEDDQVEFAGAQRDEHGEDGVVRLECIVDDPDRQTNT